MTEGIRIRIPPLESKRWPAGDVPPWPQRDWQSSPDRESISNALAALNLLDVEIVGKQGEEVGEGTIAILRHASEIAFDFQPSAAAIWSALRIMHRLSDHGSGKKPVTPELEQAVHGERPATASPAPAAPATPRRPRAKAAPPAPPAPPVTGKVKIKVPAGEGVPS